MVEEVDGSRYVYFASEKATAYKLKDEGTSSTVVWSVSLGLKDPSPNDKAAFDDFGDDRHAVGVC